MKIVFATLLFLSSSFAFANFSDLDETQSKEIVLPAGCTSTCTIKYTWSENPDEPFYIESFEGSGTINVPQGGSVECSVTC